MEKSTCNHCGIEYATGKKLGIRRPHSLFCSEKCRIDANNGRRAILRAKKRVISAFQGILLLSGNAGTKNAQNQQIASDVLAEIAELINRNVGTGWQCANQLCNHSMQSVAKPKKCPKCDGIAMQNIKPMI